MNFEILINFQRKIRASLSFISNKSEKLNKSDLKLIDEVGNMANNLMNKNSKHYKKTHVIFSNEVLNIILKKKLKNFLKRSFIQKMFFVHNRLFLMSYLNEIKKNIKWKLWKILLKENNIGSPIKYFLSPFTSGNKIFQTFHLMKFHEYTKNNIKNYDFILEFGGGYGNMCEMFNRIRKGKHYVLFDTPEVNLLQYYYLKRNKIKVGFNANDKNKVLLMNSLLELKKLMLRHKNKKKLFIANWSLSETPLSFRKEMKFIFEAFDYQLISFQNNFENINNLKYFKKLNKFNIKKKRKSILIPVKKLRENNYLFSKI
tara:strand:+ start:1657 stop:2601 length:945 start_codon:yes stop_codon:yes gene_type:complete